MRVTLLDAGEPERLSAYTSGHVELEPIGLEYLAGTLEANGHTAEVLPRARDQSLPEYARAALSQSPRLIGISVLTYAVDRARALADLLKATHPSVAVVVGGSHPSCVPEFVRHPSFDYAVVGEGEQPLRDLVTALEAGADVDGIPGLVSKSSSAELMERRELVGNFDELAWPTRIGEYKSAGLLDRPHAEQRSIAQVSYSRGCVHQCVYCTSRAIFGSSVRWRSASRTVDEIEELIRTRGVDLVYFTDLTFNSDKTRVLRLCDEIQRRCPDIRWMCGCRINGMDRELIQAMRSAGCIRIHYGVESLDESSLDRLGRSQSLARTRSVLEATHQAGIIVRGYLMMGLPWQTREELEELGDAVRGLAIDDLRISFFTPFPGTRVFNELKDAGLLMTQDLAAYSTDEPVVRISGVSREELLGFRNDAFSRFYRSREYRTRMREKLAMNPGLRESYDDFLGFLVARGLVNGL